MSDFLQQMAASSHARLQAAKRTCSEAALLQKALATALPPRLTANPARFDLIAELKLRSPAAGQLKSSDENVEERVTAYARAGAAAVSVLTEPSRFDGSMKHLETATQALAPLNVPAMRKDFIVDPYQVIEARAAGASGVLVILRMLPRAGIEALLDCARSLGLFVLLEAFDEADIEAMHDIIGANSQPGINARGGASTDPGAGTGRGTSIPDGANTSRGTSTQRDVNTPGGTSQHTAPTQDSAPLLAGLNCRDLASLQIVPQRLIELAHLLPTNVPRVAESGVASPEDAARVAAAGYEYALVGSALMQGGDPRVLAAAMLQAGRASARRDQQRSPGEPYK